MHEFQETSFGSDLFGLQGFFWQKFATISSVLSLPSRLQRMT
jgi:hypothetical protein